MNMDTANRRIPALDPATFPLQGMRLIEASAGTGKTYTIANLFLRLLVEQGLSVENILVVTFTRAATEELRGRVRERIRDTLALWESGDEIDDDFLRQLKDKAGKEGTERLKSALACMDEAAIFTIHGFCQRLLTDNAFESGAGFEPEFVTDDSQYRQQAMRDFWRRRCYPMSTELAGLLMEQWKTPDALLKDISPYFNHHRLKILPLVALDLDGVLAELEPLRKKAAAIWAKEGDKLADELIDCKNIGHAKDTYKKETVLEAAAAVSDYFDQGDMLGLPERFALFTDSHLDASRGKKARENAIPAPSHPLFTLCERIWQLVDGFKKDFFVSIRSEALTFCREEMARRKAAGNVLAPDDLLTQTYRALQSPCAERLAAAVRKVYPVALIDEFQDTDPLQYDIFNRVYAAREDASLIMIGDPKQAIYSFRGADLFTYLTAAGQVDSADGRYSLDTNWRSTTDLVEAVNTLFGQGSPFVLKHAAGYQSVRASGRIEKNRPLVIAGDAGAAMHLWHIPVSETGKRAPVPGTWFNGWIAAAYAAEMTRLIQLGRDGKAHIGDQPLKAKDIAVLVRDRHEADYVQRALRRRGVGSAFISRDSVFESAEAAALTTLLEAVAGDGEERALRSALAGPILGWSAEGLERLARDELTLETLQLRFRDYAERWRKQGFMPMFNRLLHGEGAAARLLGLADGERRLTNLRHLGELLQSASRELSGGPEGLLRWYRQELADGRSESEDAQLRLESDENLVQIVTVHKSKGLQYPLVFLPYPWRSKPVPGKGKSLLFHDDNDELVLDLGSDAFAEHILPAERERLAEDMRLLYVALTRAEHRVYCTWGHFNSAATSAFSHLFTGASADLNTELPGKGFKLNDALIGERLTALAEKAPSCFALAELPLESDIQLSVDAESTPAIGRRRFERHLKDDWRITSYSGLTAGTHDQPERPDFDALRTTVEADSETTAAAEPTGVFAFPRGTRAGHCLHGVLEEMDFAAGDTPALRVLVQRHLKRQGFGEHWEDLIAEWLLSVLDTELDSATGLRLNQVATDERIAEMGFHLPLAEIRAGALQKLLDDWRGRPGPAFGFGSVKGMLNGFIDLIVAHQGRYFVLDYKSNHLGNAHADYTGERLKNAVLEHQYDLQYLIYSVALHRYLGRRLPDYDYERDFGGVYYLFLRGMRQGAVSGIYRDRPDKTLIDALDSLFGNDFNAAGEQLA